MYSVMRLGIYGGTFDPVHYGHLVLAEQCREQCELDEVRFVPAASPPHKDDEGITAARHRRNLLEFALAGCPELSISDIELRREGPSYTVDTVQSLVDEDPQRDLFVLMGMDSLVDFPTWREPQRILQMATVVAANRRSVHDNQACRQALDAFEQFGSGARDRVRIVEMPDIDISATDIRRRCREGRSIRFLTPRPVAMYIHEHVLYHQSAEKQVGKTSP